LICKPTRRCSPLIDIVLVYQYFNNWERKVATHGILNILRLDRLTKPFIASSFRHRSVVPQPRLVVPVVLIISDICTGICPDLILVIVCWSDFRDTSTQRIKQFVTVIWTCIVSSTGFTIRSTYNSAITPVRNKVTQPRRSISCDISWDAESFLYNKNGFLVCGCAYIFFFK